ncbi:MAG: PH domain-containing protein [Caldilineales bacterium]|nr:PH domain-containing protein [Caldilineales bacterium]
MLSKEAKVWEVVRECNDLVKEQPILPDDSDKSIRFAIEFFQSDEIPEKAVLSSLKDGYDSVKGYLWATNKRVLFVGSQSTLFTKKPLYREFSYGNISAILYEKKILEEKIILHVSTTNARGNLASIEVVAFRKQAQSFVNYVQDKIDTLNSRKSIQQREGDFIDELERLAALNTKGMISDDEFVVAKRKLLGL